MGGLQLWEKLEISLLKEKYVSPHTNRRPCAVRYQLHWQYKISDSTTLKVTDTGFAKLPSNFSQCLSF